MRKKIIILLLAGIIPFLWFVFWRFIFVDEAARSVVTEENVEKDRAEVKILDSRGGEKAAFFAEIAKTDKERARGLMFRESLPENSGMLFIFDQEERHWFWMKNTLISLDMLFIDQNGKIVGIVSRATPKSKKLLGGWKSKFVLEINGGLAEKYGIKEGDRIKFENLNLN